MKRLKKDENIKRGWRKPQFKTNLAEDFLRACGSSEDARSTETADTKCLERAAG